MEQPLSLGGCTALALAFVFTGKCPCYRLSDHTPALIVVLQARACPQRATIEEDQPPTRSQVVVRRGNNRQRALNESLTSYSIGTPGRMDPV